MPKQVPMNRRGLKSNTGSESFLILIFSWKRLSLEYSRPQFAKMRYSKYLTRRIVITLFLLEVIKPDPHLETIMKQRDEQQQQKKVSRFSLCRSENKWSFVSKQRVGRCDGVAAAAAKLYFGGRHYAPLTPPVSW